MSGWHGSRYFQNNGKVFLPQIYFSLFYFGTLLYSFFVAETEFPLLLIEAGLQFEDLICFLGCCLYEYAREDTAKTSPLFSSEIKPAYSSGLSEVLSQTENDAEFVSPI